MPAGTSLRVEIEDKPGQSRRDGRSEVANRRQAGGAWRQSYLRGLSPFGLRLRFMLGLTRCRNGTIWLTQREGKTWEDEESGKKDEGEDAPRG